MSVSKQKKIITGYNDRITVVEHHHPIMFWRIEFIYVFYHIKA